MRVSPRDLPQRQLLFAVALLAIVSPAPAQVPTYKIIPVKPVPPPPCDGPMIATEPPHCLTKKLPPYKVPMEYQLQQLPPAEYDRKYNGELTILRTLESEVQRACRQRFKPGDRAVGCSLLTLTIPSKCTIYIAVDEVLQELGWNYDIILRHELDHCNGWHHDDKGKTIPSKKLEGWCVVDPSLWMCRE